VSGVRAAIVSDGFTPRDRRGGTRYHQVFTASRLMSSRPPSVLLRYLVGIASVAAATLVRLLIGDPLDAGSSFAIYALAAFGAGWFGGLGPGLLAAALSALCCVHPVAAPFQAFDIREIAGAVFFLAVGATLAVVASWLHRTQAALRSRQDIDPETLDMVSDAVIIADPDGRVTYMNPAAITLTGADAAAPMPHLDALLGMPRAAATLAGSPHPEQELLFEGADGKCRPVSIAVTRLGARDAKTAPFVLVLRDRISENKQEATLPHAADTSPSAAEHRLQSILDASEARLFHLDRQFRLTWANRALRERHGIDDGAGAGLATLFEPQKCAALMRPLQRAMEGHSETLEWRALDARGEPCWTLTMITPDFDERGEVRGCVVLCLDATTRHRADAARRRSEDQRRGLLENLPDLIWMAAADGTGEWFSHRWAEYTGRSIADWRDPIHPDEAHRASAAWLLAQAKGKPLGIEVRLRRHDDVWRWHLVRAHPLRESVTDNAIWGWCGSCTDIDDQKQAAATLRTTQQRISGFLGTLSHELRNPLAAVSAAVQVLRHPRAAPEMTARATETLDRQAALLARMVEELLDAARVMEGRIDLQRRRVSLNQLVGEVCADLSARAAEKGVRLDCAIPEQDILVDADLLRIKQALENIVINALNACAAEETVTVRAIEGQAGEAGIRVADTGCGISPESLAHLFEPGSPPRHERTSGLGLGLKTVHRIMQLHGGRIVANSEGAGKGATFDLLFPLYDARAAEEAAQAESEHSALLAGQRILIISNAAAEIDPLLAPLQHCGAQVRCATHGFEGLRIAEAWTPTALVCDLALPTPLSGYDVVRQMLVLPVERRPRLLAIADDIRVDAAQARDAGFDDCLIRPVSLQRLLGALSQDRVAATAL
jgi:PAS domain S-box-containing protein